MPKQITNRKRTIKLWLRCQLWDTQIIGGRRWTYAADLIELELEYSNASKIWYATIWIEDGVSRGSAKTERAARKMAEDIFLSVASVVDAVRRSIVETRKSPKNKAKVARTPRKASKK